MAFIEAVVSSFQIISAEPVFVLIGVFIGFTLGMIPGMGGSVALAIMLPFSLMLTPEQAFIAFGSALGATSFSGSLTAILLNTPGTAGNTATLLDGYPLTRQGKAKLAIGASASASAFGAMIGLWLFLLLIPVVIPFTNLFHSPEIFWIALAGIVIIPFAVQGSMIKGLIAGTIGMIFAFHGLDFLTGEFRFDWILIFFERTARGEVSLIPVIVGLFAIAEVIKLGIKGEKIVTDEDPLGSSDLIPADAAVGESQNYLWEGIISIFKSKFLFIQSAIIGFLIGVIPGVGASVANMVSYGFASGVTKRGEEFGSGNIDGVIASEAANDSKDGGQLLPTFALGIPGSGSTAILIGAFVLHGMVPGPQFMHQHLDIALVTFWALLLSNILTSVIGIVIADYVVHVTKVDITFLLPLIIMVSLAAVFIARHDPGDIYLTLVFAVIGLVLMAVNTTRVPLVIAVVLGRIMESNFYRNVFLTEAQGDIVYFFARSPLTLVIVLLVITLLIIPPLQYFRRRAA